MDHKKYKPEKDYLFDITSANSVNECTGLIPSAPQNDSELESYQEILPFMPSDTSSKNHPSKK